MNFLKIGLWIFVSRLNWWCIAAFPTDFDFEAFAKDVTSIVVESTLTSKCNANTFMTSKSCGYYISSAVQSLSQWAPPVLITSFDGNALGLQTEGYDNNRRKEQWNKFLVTQRKTCSLILICDLSEDFNTIPDLNFGNDTFPNSSLFIPLLTEKPKVQQIPNTEFLNLRKFITVFDHVLYLHNPRDEDGLGLMGLQEDYGENPVIQVLHNSILKLSGILLSLEVENRTLSTESLFRVYSKCKFCGRGKQSLTDLGNWQRNKTQFSKYFPVFDKYAIADFNGYNLTVGYFDYPPHFSASAVNEVAVYSGVEWQMLSQMSESFNFNFNLVNLTHDSNISPKNVSTMIEAIRNGSIELAVGGISVTRERKTYVDFSKIFSHEPIVFVVAKRQDIYILGIWLAFQPQVWPLIISLILIMAFLFRTILRKPSNHLANAFLSNNYLYFLLRKSAKEYRSSIGMFRALEITLTPLLGQSLAPAILTKMSSRLIKLLLVIWWFSCLIISTLYNTSLITSLINPVTPKEPESLQDLINFGYKFKLGCKPGVVYELISTEIGSKLDHIKATEERAKLVDLLKQLQSRLAVTSTQSSLVAYVVEESSVDEINWKSKEIGFSQIKVIRERLFLTWYGWPLQRAAPYKEKIDAALGRLASAGLIDYWYLNYSHKEKEPTDGMFKLRKKLGQIHLNMEVLQGAFLFLFLGCGVAVIAFAIENFKVKYTFRFFTKSEIIAILKKTSSGILFYIEKISGGHRNRVVFVQNEGNTPLRNHKFREAVLQIVNIRKSYPYMK